MLEAVDYYRRGLKGVLPGLPQPVYKRPVKSLMETYGCAEKVACRAIDREISRDLMDWGVNPYIGWLTDAGTAKLEELRAVN